MTAADKLTRLFKALSVPNRVDIIRLLQDRTLCVNALAAKLGVTPAAVSQHLRILRYVGLVVAEKRGYFVHYTLNATALRDLKRQIDGFVDPRKCRKRKGQP